MSSSKSGSSLSFSDKAFAGVGNLIKLLPTGTIFLYQFASPILTNGGGEGFKGCAAVNKTLDAILIVLCGLSCFFACFTDSFTDPSDGKRRYGIVTINGLWTKSGEIAPDLSRYRLRLGDFAHAFLSLSVFAAIALLDSNTVKCFYPNFEADQKLLIQVVPAVIGAFSGVVFMLFPNERHGIGYPFTTNDHTPTTNNNNNLKGQA